MQDARAEAPSATHGHASRLRAMDIACIERRRRCRQETAMLFLHVPAGSPAARHAGTSGRLDAVKAMHPQAHGARRRRALPLDGRTRPAVETDSTARGKRRGGWKGQGADSTHVCKRPVSFPRGADAHMQHSSEQPAEHGSRTRGHSGRNLGDVAGPSTGTGYVLTLSLIHI